MTNGIRNALLFGAGALVAAIAVAYGSGAFAPAPVEKVAETTQPEPTENSMTAKEGRVPATPQKSTEAAPDKAEAGSSGDTKTDQSAAKGDAAPGGDIASTGDGDADANAKADGKAAPAPGTAKSADVTAPSFDVVRAEGDGSIVVAGRAAPGAKVEVLSGKSVLGTSTAGAEGDFAIVLDNPLKPGDYQLVLRATKSANVVAMSKETAVVSIPEHENGQVLALVEAPGQPSKLITIPKPEKTAKNAPAPAAPKAAQPGTPDNNAALQPPAAGAPSGDGSKQPAPAAGAGAGTGQETAAANKKPSEGDAAGGAAQAPAQPPSNQAAGDRSTGDQSNGAQPSATASKPQVSVEAVEIEGNKIFVAGVADPGSTVRVYANDAVLGEAKTSPVGRFLVEAIHELAVGDYIIRADMLGPDGLKVAARAAVPFTRAPGESVAAVASGEAGSANTDNGAAAAPAGPTTAKPGAVAGGAAGETGNQAANGAANPAPANPRQPSTAAGSDNGAAPGAPTGAGTAPAMASNGQGSAVLPPLKNGISQQPPTIVAPKLQETSGAVIIRRGDTLWQISRRVYGHGIRYSTIYLANEDQIENPDLIWPGQIFAVPNETKEGEAANMKAIAGQATELPKKAVE